MHLSYLIELRMRELWGAQSPILVDRSMRSRTIRHVLRDWDEELGKRPDLVMVHVGITDCAPRVFSEPERWVV